MSDSPLPTLLLPGTSLGATPALPESGLQPAEPLSAADPAGLAHFANILARGLQPTAAPSTTAPRGVEAPRAVGSVAPVGPVQSLVGPDSIPMPSALAPVPAVSPVPGAPLAPSSVADAPDPQTDDLTAAPEDSTAEDVALAMAALAGGLAPSPAPLTGPPRSMNLPAGPNRPAAANLPPNATAAGAPMPPWPGTLAGQAALPTSSAEAGPQGMADAVRASALPATDVAASVAAELAAGSERAAAGVAGEGITALESGPSGASPNAAQPSALAPATAERPAPPLPSLAERAAWGESLAERLTWLVQGELEQAQLELNPPELGRLDVRLRLQGDQASVSFASGAAEVREALEQALPRLREMLADAGIELTDAQVGAHPRERETAPETAPGLAAADEPESAVPASAEHTGLAPAVRGDRLIDRFV